MAIGIVHPVEQMYQVRVPYMIWVLFLLPVTGLAKARSDARRQTGRFSGVDRSDLSEAVASGAGE